MILPPAIHSQLIPNPPPPKARSLSRYRRAMPSLAHSPRLATARSYRLHTLSLVRHSPSHCPIPPNSRGGFMEPAASLVRLPVSNRAVACLWCHATTTHADVIRNHGLCQSCAHDNVEIGWRLVYD